MWAGGGEDASEICIDEDYLDSLRSAGAPPDVIEQVRKAAKKSQKDFEVFEDNWQSLLFFVGLKTQWNISIGGMGGAIYLGLNYQSVESAMNLKQVPKKARAELFNDLQVMEEAALEVLNKAKG